jgi:hypothetical protein
MPKPTFASVTEQSCTCDYLQKEANDPESPIIFDEPTGEYQFTYQEPGCEGRSTLVIYHCPFCGGTAPESKRALLFAVIPRAEEERLAEILAPIQTIKDALATFGTPDFDGFVEVRQHERDDKPSTRAHHRQIRYERLSEVADVWIDECPDGRAFWQLQGKYVGKRPEGIKR